ncbi:hypothetical protein L873DRAFT_1794491 [Choiromyces venosus 120613-1]|uniref:Uncharacterized protein n=1 Tax=Choiromyces venosus 120613-1 TaxID=1336337 RepID=A0A3N4J667_9PEZI|nr:hypothetical protein L873DRAFT_1794491 [Choiromyces venosus 120613-1]
MLFGPADSDTEIEENEEKERKIKVEVVMRVGGYGYGKENQLLEVQGLKRWQFEGPAWEIEERRAAEVLKVERIKGEVKGQGGTKAEEKKKKNKGKGKAVDRLMEIKKDERRWYMWTKLNLIMKEKEHWKKMSGEEKLDKFEEVEELWEEDEEDEDEEMGY